MMPRFYDPPRTALKGVAGTNTEVQQSIQQIKSKAEAVSLNFSTAFLCPACVYHGEHFKFTFTGMLTFASRLESCCPQVWNEKPGRDKGCKETATVFPQAHLHSGHWRLNEG